jgi:hypothetical protein
LEEHELIGNVEIRQYRAAHRARKCLLGCSRAQECRLRP